jgi:hypothetical protein
MQFFRRHVRLRTSVAWLYSTDPRCPGIDCVARKPTSVDTVEGGRLLLCTDVRPIIYTAKEDIPALIKQYVAPRPQQSYCENTCRVLSCSAPTRRLNFHILREKINLEPPVATKIFFHSRIKAQLAEPLIVMSIMSIISDDRLKPTK